MMYVCICTKADFTGTDFIRKNKNKTTIPLFSFALNLIELIFVEDKPEKKTHFHSFCGFLLFFLTSSNLILCLLYPSPKTNSHFDLYVPLKQVVQLHSHGSWHSAICKPLRSCQLALLLVSGKLRINFAFKYLCFSYFKYIATSGNLM